MDTLVKEPLQTDHSPVCTVERQDPLTVRVIIRTEPADGAGFTLSHHDAVVLASRLADDLKLATWEDAEWR